MANRFWVGGTGNWDAATTTNWSDTSGGAGGFSVPTSADDVFFDAASGAGTVTVTATATCLSLNFTGFTQTFAGSSALDIYGSLTLASGMTLTYTGLMTYRSTSTGRTITTAGKTLLGGTKFNGVGGSWVMQDNYTQASIVNWDITNGHLDTNGVTVTTSSSSTAWTVSAGATLTLGSSLLFIGQLTVDPSATLNSGTSLITINGTTNTLAGGGKTFYDVIIRSGSSTITITGSNTFNSLIVNVVTGSPSQQGNLVFTDGTTTTTASLSVFGRKNAEIPIVKSGAGANPSIVVSADTELVHVAVGAVNVSGGAHALVKHGYARSDVGTGWEFASYPANDNIIRPAMFSPGRAR